MRSTRGHAATASARIVSCGLTARAFARENFGARHRYAMALHTHQDHPHVHLVVKAEGRDGLRVHIDKAMLRAWREHFAELMRAQGVPANATPRVARGRTKSRLKEASYQAIRRGRSDRWRARVHDVAREPKSAKTIHDPAHAKLLATRQAVVDGWIKVAAALDRVHSVRKHGEIGANAGRRPATRSHHGKNALKIR